MVTAKYISSTPIGAHRAMADVKAMKAVLTHPILVEHLRSLEFRAPTQQLRLWEKQKEIHRRTSTLIASLGKPSVTSAQAKRLDTLGVTVPLLLRVRSEAKDAEEFCESLKSMKINSKPLRLKLCKLVESKFKL